MRYFTRLALLLLCGLPLFALAAWTDPTGTPPTNNAEPPINVSSADQAKTGGLGVGGNFAVTGVAKLLGQVGIGTAAPSYALEVVSGQLGGDIKIGGEGAYLDRIKSATHLALQSVGDILFMTGSGGTEQARITATGKVGIGTPTPPAKLTLSNNVATGGLDAFTKYQLLLYQNSTAATSYGLGIRGGTLVFNSDSDYNFDTDGVTKASINGSGDITASRFCLPGTNPTGGCISTWSSGGSNYWTSNGTDVYRLTGGVGIGTSAPAAPLQVVNTTTGSGIQVGLDAGSGFGIRQAPGDNGLDFSSGSFSAGTSRLHLNNNGNIGVGTTNPQAKLDVVGKAAVNDGFTIRQPGVSPPYIQFEAGSNSWWHVVDEAQGLVFYTGAYGSGVKKVAFTPAGQIQLTGGSPVANKLLAAVDTTGTATWKSLIGTVTPVSLGQSCTGFADCYFDFEISCPAGAIATGGGWLDHVNNGIAYPVNSNTWHFYGSMAGPRGGTIVASAVTQCLQLSLQ